MLFMNSTSALELCSTRMSVKPSFMLTRIPDIPNFVHHDGSNSKFFFSLPNAEADYEGYFY